MLVDRNLTVDFFTSQFLQLIFILLLLPIALLHFLFQLEILGKKRVNFLLQNCILVLELVEHVINLVLLWLVAIHDSGLQDGLNDLDKSFLAALIEGHNGANVIIFVRSFSHDGHN